MTNEWNDLSDAQTPAAKIATTVARAIAARGDDVGPNVTLVLLAELEALADRVEVAERFARSQSDREFELLALLESRDQHIKELMQAALQMRPYFATETLTAEREAAAGQDAFGTSASGLTRHAQTYHRILDELDSALESQK